MSAIAQAESFTHADSLMEVSDFQDAIHSAQENVEDMADGEWRRAVALIGRAVKEQVRGKQVIGPLSDGTVFDARQEMSSSIKERDAAGEALRLKLDGLVGARDQVQNTVVELSTQLTMDKIDLAVVRQGVKIDMVLLFPEVTGVEELRDLLWDYHFKNHQFPAPENLTDVLDSISDHRVIFSEQPSLAGRLLEGEANKVREFLNSRRPGSTAVVVKELLGLRDKTIESRSLRARIDHNEGIKSRLDKDLSGYNDRIRGVEEKLENQATLPELMTKIVTGFVTSQYDKDRMAGLKNALGDSFPDDGEHHLDRFHRLRDAAQRLSQKYQEVGGSLPSDDFWVIGAPDSALNDLRFALEEIRESLVELSTDLGIDFKLPGIDMKPKRKKEDEIEKVAGMAL